MLRTIHAPPPAASRSLARSPRAHGPIFCLVAAAVAVLAAGGCSAAKPVSNRPQTHPARGRLTLAGQPLTGATVTFRPDGQGNGCSGISDAAGAFRLATFTAGDGAVPGKYRVTVTKFAAGPPAPDVNAPGYAPPSASAPPPKSLLADSYADPAKSGLTAEVVAGKDNVFEFDLKP